MKNAEQRRASAHQRFGSGTARATASTNGSFLASASNRAWRAIPRAGVRSARCRSTSSRELDSGERLITERVTSVRSVSLGFWIGAGARDEPDAKAGVSHFIEHLLFKGTRSYDAQQIAEIFDEMGGELNAATSREHTVVYARVPDRHLEDALDVMADMVFAPTFADLDSEREVVLEEIAMVEDAPQELVHDLLSEAVFCEHPLGRPVIGRAEVISSIGRRSISAYHRGAYVAGNVVLAAAGNLEHDARRSSLLERAARQRVEPPARRTKVRTPLVREPAPGLRFQRKDTEQFHVCVGAPGIARSDRRRFAASLLDAILGGSASSRLFQEIREKRGMAYSVYSFASQYTDTGPGRDLRRHARGEPRRLPRDRRRARSPTSPPATCASASWSGRRRT